MAAEVDVVVAAVVGLAGPFEAGERHEAARRVEFALGRLLRGVVGVGVGVVVALVADEGDGGGVTGVAEEVRDFLCVRDLSAVGVAPVERAGGLLRRATDGIALGGEGG